MLIKLTTYKGNQNKRFTAHFSNGKRVHFGLQNPSIGTYIDHKNPHIKINYIKRHRVNENWSDPYKPGTLSRYLLWEYTNLNNAILEYNKKFF